MADTGSHARHVLIVDQGTSYPIDVCRTLAGRGFLVDAFAPPGAPLFRSLSCHCRIASPPWYASDFFLKELQSTVNRQEYDLILVCSEEVLRLLPRVVDASPCWRGLLLPDPETLPLVLDKNAAVRRVADEGLPVPRTVVPVDDGQVDTLGHELGFPLLVKGERGGASRNVVIVDHPALLPAAYRQVCERERDYGGRPALQEFVSGPTYSVGGLFDRGRALRLCAHRLVLMHPSRGGATVRGITERPAGLLEAACTAFAAFGYSGLGQMDFIQDRRDGTFKFLELNPRIWATIGLARQAGVDLLAAYRALVHGETVAPDLRYRTGVRYHRMSAEIQLVMQEPRHLPGLLWACVDPRVHSDFDWRDPGPHLALGRLTRAWSDRSVDAAAPGDALPFGST